VLKRHRAWVRLRVHGLLRNPGLALALEAEAATLGSGPLDINLATGSVRATLGPGRDERFWVEWLHLRVGAPAGRRPAAAVAPAPRKSTESPAPGRRSSAARAKTRLLEASRGADAPSDATSDDTPDDLSHEWPFAELLERLALTGTGWNVASGLSTADAADRLARFGPNAIRDVTGRTPMQILLDQYRSVPVALLGASAGLSLLTRAWVDAGAIGAVLAANGALGYTTERDAERTVSSLRRLAPGQATVLRDGQRCVIDSREVVVGDLLVLAPGEAVAADARVIESHRLAANESALTGESLPVRKEPVDALPPGTPLAERRNTVYMGTVVSGGVGLALVVATGERASLGRIRRLAQASESPRTQLQVQLDALGRNLAVGAAGLCVGVFAIGLLRGRPALPLLRTTVSLAVAAIPEGLPTVATSILASGIETLRRRNVFARSLDAVESLGAVDTVCFDKTGTLTLNRMTVTSVTVGAELRSIDAGEPVGLPEVWARVAALCNTVEHDTDAPGAPLQGSSTELALVALAVRLGVDFDRLRRSHPALGVRHRSEHHPYMVTLHDSADRGLLVAVKGRPDEVLARCEHWWDGQRVAPLRPADRVVLAGLNDRMAAHGERVLALAYREHPERTFGETAGLCWLGLAGLSDPLREDLPEMIGRLRAAGIRPVMITGDQIGTAAAVAGAIGLDRDFALVDAAALPESAEEIGEVVESSSGFARTTPGMKLEIIRALQAHGHVVAMTGDGINDGPALKSADVGMAMGVTGTDFAHAMSDLVLRDDHPAGLLVAVEEGRTAFVNVRKAVRYLVATNLSELATTAIAVTAGLPEPFDPLALLWTNLITDVWPAIALGLEPAEPGIMERPPVSLAGGVLERGEWTQVAIDAGTMTVASLASFGWGLARYGPGPQARTLAFATLTSSQLLYALAMRSRRPLGSDGQPPNPRLRRAIAWSLVAQAGTVTLPPLRRLLRTTPLGPADFVVVAATAVLPLAARELLKRTGR